MSYLGAYAFPYSFAPNSVPGSALDSATQAKINGAVQKAGDTMTGALNMKGTPVVMQNADGSTGGLFSYNPAFGIGFINKANTAWNFYVDDSGNVTARGQLTCINQITINPSGGASPAIQFNGPSSSGPRLQAMLTTPVGLGITNDANTLWNFTLDDSGNSTVRGTFSAGGLLTSVGLKSTANGAIIQGQTSPAIGNGLTINWNESGGNGETDFVNCNNGAPGGFNFRSVNANNTIQTMICSMDSVGAFHSNATIMVGSFPQSRSTNTANTGQTWQVGADGGSSYCIYANGGAGVWMGWGGTAWNANSDGRLKNIRGEITDAVNKVKQIRSVLYSWKRDDDECEARGLENDSRVSVGVIAQDVEKVQPEAVNKNADGYLSVAYTELIPLLLASVRELADKLDSFGSRIAALEAKVG